jgi:hypothetical protein
MAATAQAVGTARAASAQQPPVTTLEERARVQVLVRKLGAINRWSWVKSFGAIVVAGSQW